MLKRMIAATLSVVMATAVATIVIPAESAAAAAAKQEKSSKASSGKERRTKCSAEWKEAKAAGKTANVKWPKFYSDCNKRLKAQGV